MNIPVNVKRFFWQGKDSASVGLVLTTIPQIAFAGRRVDETFTYQGVSSNMFDNGIATFDLSFGVAYLGEKSEDEFIAEIADFFSNKGTTPLVQDLLWFPRKSLSEYTENELDVCYEAKFISQTAWDTNGRWKTATITFHCQGYKHYINTTTKAKYNLFLELRSKIVTTDMDIKLDGQVDMNRKPRICVSMDTSTASFQSAEYIRIELLGHYNLGNVTDSRGHCVGRQWVFKKSDLTILFSGATQIVIIIDVQQDRIFAYDQTLKTRNIYNYTNKEEYVAVVSAKDTLIYMNSDTGRSESVQVNYSIVNDLVLGPKGKQTMPMPGSDTVESIACCYFDASGTAITTAQSVKPFQVTYFPNINIG